MVERNTNWRRVFLACLGILEGSDPRFKLMACDMPVTVFKNGLPKLPDAITTDFPIDGESLTSRAGDLRLAHFVAPGLR